MSEPPYLLTILRACTVPEQLEMAALAGTKRNYLYQIAAGERTPNIVLAKRISDATKTMHVRTMGRIPKISLDQIAEMCPGR